MKELTGSHWPAFMVLGISFVVEPMMECFVYPAARGFGMIFVCFVFLSVIAVIWITTCKYGVRL